MRSNFSERQLKVAEVIKKSLAMIFLKNNNYQEFIGDSILSMTISQIEMSADLKIARVYMSLIYRNPKQENFSETISAINNISGLVRKELAAKVRLRYIPLLRFTHDDTSIRAVKLENIINRAMQEINCD